MSLLSASPEVLRTIVLHALDDRPCGPPHEWYGLVLSCRTLQRQLDTPAIHALLFTAAFHVPTSARPTLSAHAKAELTRRFTVLKFLKRGASCLEEAGLTDALWVANGLLRIH
ncbi:hypothetical protein FB45DRAFT_1040314 [Roridomyces roridus]|uniref:F-box domain-containing protein n=1 Tax=Roridomyces roridus TaxID=1738132 RepID=A0AAD7B1H6_9AGAR|nr:hypothetical protein FB45DRAFT_1040314 [Roridomyces roridus]